MAYISSIKLQNITVFSDLDLSFSTGINIFIGENGAGKTHLLKLLYAAAAITTGEDKEKTFSKKLVDVFGFPPAQLYCIGRRCISDVEKQLVPSMVLIENTEHQDIKTAFNCQPIEGVEEVNQSWDKNAIKATYIPVKEILSNAPGFLSTLANRELAFEAIYGDIVKRALLPRKRVLNPLFAELVAVLKQKIGGEVIAQGERFFIVDQYGELDFNLLAEGFRKLALLCVLIENGCLEEGAVLFWDEPEANLNPNLMGIIAGTLLKLQRLGVQIFLSTHNYVLLKEFDLRKDAAKHHDQVTYFAFAKDKQDNVTVSKSDNYMNLQPNLIADTFDDLYHRQLDRTLGV